MLLGQRYDRSHCCICDIKKDLEPETSSLWRPEEGERDFCFLCGAVSDTEVCFVSEWTPLTPHTSHPASEGGSKIGNWTQTLTGHNSVTGSRLTLEHYIESVPVPHIRISDTITQTRQRNRRKSIWQSHWYEYYKTKRVTQLFSMIGQN